MSGPGRRKRHSPEQIIAKLQQGSRQAALAMQDSQEGVQRCVSASQLASQLLNAVVEDIKLNPDAKGKKLYLHAQLDAMPLYAKFGFRQVGDMFEECKIKHFKMELYL